MRELFNQKKRGPVKNSDDNDADNSPQEQDEEAKQAGDSEPSDEDFTKEDAVPDEDIFSTDEDSIGEGFDSLSRSSRFDDDEGGFDFSY